MSLDDFYFNPNNMEVPYCYYRDTVLLDFSRIDNKIDNIKALISRINKEINESVAKRNFDRFLDLVDDRLVPELFMEVFNFIPDQDKYRLFERVWKYNENGHKFLRRSLLRRQ